CPAFCGAQTDCRIPAADCEDACNDAPDADVAGCVADALRVGTACGGVAACVDHRPEAAGEDCTALCDARRRCEADLDPYLCRLDCTPTPPRVPVQRACADVAVCAELPGCLALDANANPACEAPCQGAVECGAFPDLASCMAVCTGREAAPRTPEGWAAQIPACIEAAFDGMGVCDAAAARECFEVPLCENVDRVIVLPGNGGRLNVNTADWPQGQRANCGGGGPQAVLAITLQRAANLTVETTNNQFDTLIHIRSDCDDQGSEIACNDDGGVGVASRISQQLQAGTYFIFIDGFGARAGVTDVVVTVQ
ncbi:MAG: hypothetical protein KC613_12465, partial [Myxococcales bacterium]|nr:hypothetical protein [Myxococcales bacterium]